MLQIGRRSERRALQIGGLLLFVSGMANAVVPAAPTNLSATAVSTTQINLSWTDNSNNETSFKIERKTNTTSFSQIATVGTDVHTFSDTGLVSATTYTYRVRASNSSGNSSYTNTASATTQGQDTTAPSTPGGLTATPASPSQINLAWNASNDAVGVTGYRVERCQGSGCTTFAQIATPTGTSFSDTGLTAKTAYRYRVRATDAAGNLSAYSSLASATSSSVGPVGAWGLNGVIGATQADYSGNNNRGTPVNGINGLVPTTTGKFGSALVFGGPNVGVDLGNPAPLKITGSMTLSAWIYSTAFPIDDAAVVSKLEGTTGFQLDTTVDTGPRTIGFKLGAPGGNLMIRYGATVLQLNQWYHVAGVYDAGTQAMTVYLNGVPDNGTLAGTVAGRQIGSTRNVNIGRRADDSVDYNFSGTIDEVRIYDRALSAAEIQADMNAAIAPPSPDAVSPSAPTNLALSAMGATQVHAQWTNSSDNFDVTAYRVERCQGSGCTDFTEIAAVSNFKLEDTGLTAATIYSYRVRATDGAGNFSGYSSVASAATPGTNPEGGRVGAYPFDEGSGATTADFSGFGNNGTLNGSVDWTAAGKYGNALSFSGGYVDLGNPGTLQLTGSVTLSAWIYSTAFPVDDAAIVSKRGDETGYQIDTTVDTGPRTIGFKLADPFGSKMMRYGASVLQLNQWYHVAGVYDAQAQTLNVYLNGQLDNGALVGTVASSQLDSLVNVLIGHRSPANGYEFIGTIDDVRIYNRALSQAEIQADMTVPASAPPGDTTPPTAPSALSATAAGAGQINLSWTASTDNVGVTGYRVERCQGAGCATFAQIATSVATAFSDTGLVAATSYSYRVRAADAAGNLSAYSNVAGAAVSASPPLIFGQTPRDVTLPGGSTPQVGAAYVAQSGTEIDLASVRILFDGVNVTSQATITASGVLYPVTQPLGDAAHTVVVSVASVGGSLASETWSFTVDDPAPNFHGETPRDVFVADRRPRIRVLLSGLNIAASSIRMTLDGSDVTAQADVGIDHVIFTPVSALADGLHAVNVVATDGRGVAAAIQWSFTVDVPPPATTTDDGARTPRTFVPGVRALP